MREVKNARLHHPLPSRVCLRLMRHASADEMFTGQTFFAKSARFGCPREQKRANQYEVIRSDRCTDGVESCPVKRSEAERGHIAERDERRDARDHIRFGEQ